MIINNYNKCLLLQHIRCNHGYSNIYNKNNWNKNKNKDINNTKDTENCSLLTNSKKRRIYGIKYIDII